MTIIVNGNEYKGTVGQTILSLANENNIYIPTMCHVEELTPSGACGICVVEVVGSSRLLRACATPVSNGMKIHTQSEKVINTRKTLLELSLSTHSGDCVAPCMVACPAKTDCQGYITLISEGKTNEAVALMKEAHPFPASIARICPRPCEEKCRRSLVDEAVNIAGLKRFAADLSVAYTPEVMQETGKKIAIVGGGPAGLTAAYFLRRGGYMVAIFEQMPKMGGLLRYGIPEYRLPKAVLDKELDVLQKIGIIFENNMAIGEDFTINQLQENYDGVVIAIGAGASKPMWCKGEDAQGVWGGIDFLKAIAKNEPFLLSGKRVVVVGGSNTAMDAARTALRLGAEAIVSYRRTRDEMPADNAEVEEAIADGVQFLFLTAPKEITTKNKHVTGITVQKMALGEPDTSGRRSPIPIEGADEWIQAHMIIGAIGQDVVMQGLAPLENLKVDNNFRTQLPGVYAIGDATSKSSYAIDAIAHGKKLAAIVLDDMRLPWETLPHTIVQDTKTAADFSHIQNISRKKEVFIKLKHDTPFAEARMGLTQEQATEEAKRCLSCGCKAFKKCKLLKLSNMYMAETDKFSATTYKKIKHPVDRRSAHIHRDINKCVHCYLCVRACSQLVGKGVFGAIARGFDSIIDTAFGEQMPDGCRNCDKCVKHCPTGALTFV